MKASLLITFILFSITMFAQTPDSSKSKKKNGFLKFLKGVVTQTVNIKNSGGSDPLSGGSGGGLSGGNGGGLSGGSGGGLSGGNGGGLSGGSGGGLSGGNGGGLSGGSGGGLSGGSTNNVLGRDSSSNGLSSQGIQSIDINNPPQPINLNDYTEINLNNPAYMIDWSYKVPQIKLKGGQNPTDPLPNDLGYVTADMYNSDLLMLPNPFNILCDELLLKKEYLLGQAIMTKVLKEGAKAILKEVFPLTNTNTGVTLYVVKNLRDKLIDKVVDTVVDGLSCVQCECYQFVKPMKKK
jgi:hypothetical protein